MLADHGGDLGRARAVFGGSPADWIDLSTGINRVPYPIPDIPADCWHALPDKPLFDAITAAARAAYGTDADCLALSGAQAAIQLIPRAFNAGHVAILSPTYNEHASCFRAAGWKVTEVADRAALPDADACVIVNPNNPDGRITPTDRLIELSKRFRLLIVDESFADATPHCSIAAQIGQPGTIILRSFGKFYGLAGMRLGFALGHTSDLDRLRQRAGPWAVNGPALHIGINALRDQTWQHNTRLRLQIDADRLDAMALTSGFAVVGGCPLFRLYHVADATTVHTTLAKAHIWSRIFPGNQNWVRLGLPGSDVEWDRLGVALGACSD